MITPFFIQAIGSTFIKLKPKKKPRLNPYIPRVKEGGLYGEFSNPISRQHRWIEAPLCDCKPAMENNRWVQTLNGTTFEYCPHGKLVAENTTARY